MSDETSITPVSRRAGSLAAVAILQGFCAAFFFADAMSDFHLEGVGALTVLEGAVSVALVIGTIATILLMRQTIEENRRAVEALSLAKGAFAEVMQRRFSAWDLSPAEAEVAMFLLKGLDAGEIADLRGSAQGTVRSQLAAVYRKSEVSNRTQFAAIFLDDLMDGSAA